MPLRRRLCAPLIVMFGVVMAVVAFASPASASPYITQPTISVTDQTPTAGVPFGVCGEGFKANETVTILLDQNRGSRGTTLGTAKTDPSGAFPCTSVILSALGAHKITVVDASGLTATTKARVVKSGVSVHGVSASSGTKVAGVSHSASGGVGVGSLGGLLLGGGAIMVFAGRRPKVNA
jgi:hypothetical protein